MHLLHIPYIRGIRLLQSENIIRIEGLSNYSKIFFANQANPMVVAKVLHWFEEQLPADMFARVHRSHLVNKRYVSEIKGMALKTLLLTNGESIAISRRKRGALA